MVFFQISKTVKLNSKSSSGGHAFLRKAKAFKNYFGAQYKSLQITLIQQLRWCVAKLDYPDRLTSRIQIHRRFERILRLNYNGRLKFKFLARKKHVDEKFFKKKFTKMAITFHRLQLETPKLHQHIYAGCWI